MQSSKYPRYAGIVDALRSLSQEHGSPSRHGSWWGLVRGLYPHFCLTLVDRMWRALTRHSQSLVMQRFFRVSVHRQPLLYGLLHFGVSMVGLLVWVPLDTVRKRLQVQRRQLFLLDHQPASDPNATACVPLSTVPYTGLWNCLGRIVNEEAVSDSVSYTRSHTRTTRTTDTTRGRRRRRARQPPHWKSGVLGGVVQLYRPFTFWAMNKLLYSLASSIAAFNIADEQDHYYF